MQDEKIVRDRLSKARQFIVIWPKLKSWMATSGQTGLDIFVNNRIGKEWEGFWEIKFSDTRISAYDLGLSKFVLDSFPILQVLNPQTLQMFAPIGSNSVHDAASELYSFAYVYHYYSSNPIKADRIVREGPRNMKGELDIFRLDSELKRLGFPYPSQSNLDFLVAFSVASRPSTRSEMTWTDYENECLVALKHLGFQGEKTNSGADFGADILCEKSGLTYAVQCKLYANSVGIKAVQEALSARSFYKADFAVVISESDFTSAAKELADISSIFLGKLETLRMLEHHYERKTL